MGCMVWKILKDQFWAKTMISFVGSGATLAVVLIASIFIK